MATKSSAKKGSSAVSVAPEVPRTVENIVKDLSDQGEVVTGLCDAEIIIKRIVVQALAECPWCGSFLAELLSCLSKRRSQLTTSNRHFRIEYAERESSRPGTEKRSGLRHLIHRILWEAQHQKIWLTYPYSRPVSPQQKADSIVLRAVSIKNLLGLPEFNTSKDAIQRWTDTVVLPCLLDDPEIRKLKKARDRNGKFQISRLKPLIRQTVARIAALPRFPTFFDPEDEPFSPPIFRN